MPTPNQLQPNEPAIPPIVPPITEPGRAPIPPPKDQGTLILRSDRIYQ